MGVGVGFTLTLTPALTRGGEEAIARTAEEEGVLEAQVGEI